MPSSKKYTLSCDRCGITVSYSGLSAYRYAVKKRDERGCFLCRECRRTPNRPTNFRYTGLNSGELRCSECGSVTKVVGGGRVRGYLRYYGRDCLGYKCPKCRRPKVRRQMSKTCSVCGKSEPLLSRDAEYKHRVRYANKPYVCGDCRRKSSAKKWEIRCRSCGKTSVLMSAAERSYWKYCDSTGKSYICADCRRIKADSVVVKHTPKRVENTRAFTELEKEMRRLLSVLVSRSFSDAAMAEFLRSVSKYLESKYIYEFDLDISDGRIIGLYLWKVSFYGSLYVPFENHHRAFGRRGAPT